MGILKTALRLVNNPEKFKVALADRIAKTKAFEKMGDEAYLKLLYRLRFGKKLNLKNPETFNEKLNWLKLYDRKSEYCKMVDKADAKDYVAKMIGEEYVIPTLGVWEKFDDIDFDKLPDTFVLKCTHDSGSIVIVKDKNNFDRKKAKEKLEKGLARNLFFLGREWPYKNVKPRILAEAYMEDSETQELRDYKFYCFGGTPKYLYVSRGLGGDHAKAEISFYDLNWQPAPFQRKDFKTLSIVPEKPYRLEEMIELAKRLSNGVSFLRVDFYEVDKKIYFSELTFSPCAGFMPFNPPEWDEKLGSFITLPEKTEK